MRSLCTWKHLAFQCRRLDRTCGKVVPLTLQLVRQLITSAFRHVQWHVQWRTEGAPGCSSFWTFRRSSTIYNIELCRVLGRFCSCDGLG